MTIYENASIWIEKEGFIKNDQGKLAQFIIDTDIVEHMEDLQDMANNSKKNVYVIREFVAVDADYQDQHPKKSAKDWYLLEIKPE